MLAWTDFVTVAVVAIVSGVLAPMIQWGINRSVLKSEGKRQTLLELLAYLRPLSVPPHGNMTVASQRPEMPIYLRVC